MASMHLFCKMEVEGDHSLAVDCILSGLVMAHDLDMGVNERLALALKIACAMLSTGVSCTPEQPKEPEQPKQPEPPKQSEPPKQPEQPEPPKNLTPPSVDALSSRKLPTPEPEPEPEPDAEAEELDIMAPSGIEYDAQSTPSKPIPGLRVCLTSSTVRMGDLDVIAGLTVRAEHFIPKGTTWHLNGVVVTKKPAGSLAAHYIPLNKSRSKWLCVADPASADVLRYVQYAPTPEDANVEFDGAKVTVVGDIQPWEELRAHWGSGRESEESMRTGIVWSLCMELTPAGKHDRTRKLYTAPSTLKVYDGCYSRMDPGTGLFAHTFIAKNEPMGLYLGNECDAKYIERVKAKSKMEVDETYMFALANENRLINAEDLRAASILRFINDPLISEACNAEFMAAEHEIYLVATRDIKPGEEIFASYGPNGVKNVWNSVKRQRRSAKPTATLVFIGENSDGTAKFLTHYDRNNHFDPSFNERGERSFV